MQLEPERLVKILEVLRELPVPNYRCVGPSPPAAQTLPPPGALTGPFSSGSQAPALLLPRVTLSDPCPMAPFLQDPGIPDAPLGAHGLVQRTDQHARPQPGHRLGPQPAEVRVRSGPPESGPGGGSGRSVAVWVPWKGRGGEGRETGASGLYHVEWAHPSSPFSSLSEVPEGSAPVSPHASSLGPQPEQAWPLSRVCRANVLQFVGEVAGTPFLVVLGRLGETLTFIPSAPPGVRRKQS